MARSLSVCWTSRKEEAIAGFSCETGDGMLICREEEKIRAEMAGSSMMSSREIDGRK